MKVKMDFVSNSSSTSFVYIARDMLSKQDFMAAVGVGVNSPVASLFEDMFRELKERIERGETLTSVEDIDSLENQERFTSEVIDRMKKALEQGQTVTIGGFSSENNLAEMTLCTEIFEIESERFFINAYENYW
jgi:nucleoid DNA-binding protein